MSKLRISTVIKELLNRGLDITGATLRNWCAKYNLGEKIGSVWYLDESAIDEIISGQIFLNKYKVENKNGKEKHS